MEVAAALAAAGERQWQRKAEAVQLPGRLRSLSVHCGRGSEVLCNNRSGGKLARKTALLTVRS